MAEYPRIKGANSDYKFQGSDVQEVKENGQRPSKLYLDIFLCPKGKPSTVEAEKDCCSGTKDSCPGKAEGHALIELDKDDGIKFQTDNNQLVLHQEAAKGIEFSGILTTSGQITATNSLTVKNKTAQVSLQIDAKGQVSLQAYDTSITIDASNNLVLKTPGKVSVNGNLEVNGDLKIGSLNLTADQIDKLKQLLK
jgi:hypothetical protein